METKGVLPGTKKGFYPEQKRVLPGTKNGSLAVPIGKPFEEPFLVPDRTILVPFKVLDSTFLQRVYSERRREKQNNKINKGQCHCPIYLLIEPCNKAAYIESYSVSEKCNTSLYPPILLTH